MGNVLVFILSFLFFANVSSVNSFALAPETSLRSSSFKKSYEDKARNNDYVYHLQHLNLIEDEHSVPALIGHLKTTKRKNVQRYAIFMLGKIRKPIELIA